MHRSTNTDRSRGCESFPLNENCTWVIVSDVTINMMIVDWHLPSDSPDNFNQQTAYPQVRYTLEKHQISFVYDTLRSIFASTVRKPKQFSQYKSIVIQNKFQLLKQKARQWRGTWKNSHRLPSF